MFAPLVTSLKLGLGELLVSEVREFVVCTLFAQFGWVWEVICSWSYFCFDEFYSVYIWKIKVWWKKKEAQEKKREKALVPSLYPSSFGFTYALFFYSGDASCASRTPGKASPPRSAGATEWCHLIGLQLHVGRHDYAITADERCVWPHTTEAS